MKKSDTVRRAQAPSQPKQCVYRSRMTKEFILLTLLSAGSGCATLIYALVWSQSLQSVIGSSALSSFIFLATALAATSLGSLSAGRLIGPREHPLKILALLEIGIGITGLLGLLASSYLSRLYSFTGSRVILVVTCLLLPVLLTGATFPLIARTIATKRSDVWRVGFLYGTQLAGGATGCVLAAFYLLKNYDVAGATFVAAGINVAAGLASLALYQRTRNEKPLESSDEPPAPTSAPAIVYTVAALSGFWAMGAAVVWTRYLYLLLGPSVYSVSTIWAAFLMGLGIGGCFGSAIARSSAKPGRDLGLCQTLLIPASTWGAYALTKSLPYWQIDPVLSANAWVNFHLDLSRCLWAILPAAGLCGVTFPLMLAALARGEDDAGFLTGRLLTANLIGTIAGAAACSLLFIGWLGTQRTQQILIGVAATAATLLLLRRAGVVVPVVLGVLAILAVPPLPAELVAYGRFLARNRAIKDSITQEAFVAKILGTDEGANSSVVVAQLPSGYHTLHVDGRIEGSNQPHDLRLQAMRGHIPALSNSRPRTVLVVGFGTGATVGVIALHPSVEKIVVCEIEPRIARAASQHFGTENEHVLEDPRVEMVYEDAREHMLKTEEKFDVIASAPSAPWVKGAAALYTREFFQLAKEHLNPDGVISQWLPLHEVDTDVVKSAIATFSEVFPQSTVWGNDIRAGVGYDLMLLATNGASTIDLNDIYKRLNQPDYRRVVLSLQAAGFGSVAELFASYAGRAPDLISWVSNAGINTDRNLRLQYLAGRDLNTFRNQEIYNELVAYRKYPADLFVGSEVILHVLHDLIR